uniref:Uncharacterized protein n=1 Tax=Anguilla anguilla TaxID=7936 RepID=A0A0E9X037_ANGAN
MCLKIRVEKFVPTETRTQKASRFHLNYMLLCGLPFQKNTFLEILFQTRINPAKPFRCQQIRKNHLTLLAAVMLQRS